MCAQFRFAVHPRHLPTSVRMPVEVSEGSCLFISQYYTVCGGARRWVSPPRCCWLGLVQPISQPSARQMLFRRLALVAAPISCSRSARGGNSGNQGFIMAYGLSRRPSPISPRFMRPLPAVCGSRGATWRVRASCKSDRRFHGVGGLLEGTIAGSDVRIVGAGPTPAGSRRCG